MRFRTWIFCLASALSASLSAQELCTNGIDDDADGLIDLNDPVECACSSIPVPVLDVLINPSFEEVDCIPTSYSQVECVQDWEQLTGSTSDFFHADGYMPAWIPQPLPGGGSGCVGGYFCPNYMEYVGGCLNAPLEAGVAYHLTMAIASFEIDNFLFDTIPMDLSPVEVTLYGFPQCPQMPTNISLCPGNDGWTELGSVTYSPGTVWSNITISFTPAFMVQAIGFGSPCELPDDYPSVGTEWLAYFLFDDFSLGVGTEAGLAMEASGSLCGSGVLLVGHPLDSTGEYQWFHDGIALPGATDSVLLVTDLVDGPGQYQFMVYGDSTCSGGTYTVVAPEFPTPTILEIQGELYCDETGALQWYLNGEAITGATAQSIIPGANGEYQVEVTNSSGCVGLSEPFSVINVGLPLPYSSLAGIWLSALPGSIEVTGAKRPLEFRLFAPSGQCLARAIITGDRWRYDLTTLPSGVYIAWVDGLALRVVR